MWKRPVFVMKLVCFLAVNACSAPFAQAEAGNYQQAPPGAGLLAEGTSTARTPVNSLGIKMVQIGPGTFEMGSDMGRDYWDEQPVHTVTIHTPSDAMARITALIPMRRGQILGFEPKDGWSGWDEVSAHLPESETRDLINPQVKGHPRQRPAG